MYFTTMQHLVNLFNGFDAFRRLDLPQSFLFFAEHFSWRAAQTVFGELEFLFVIVAKLMVLDRMSDFVATSPALKQRWRVGGRAVVAVVVVSSIVALAVVIAASLRFQQASQYFREASDFLVFNNITFSSPQLDLARQKVESALEIESNLLVCHAAVLLLVTSLFLAIGVLSARRINSMLVAIDAASATAETGRSVRLQVVTTTAFVFLALLLRASSSTLWAVAAKSQDTASCPVGLSLCDSCFNTYAHIIHWIAFTPEFFPIVILISSPLALLVALWGMTSKFAFYHLKHSSRAGASSASLFSQRARE